jgi:uncharacterized damage-inducible protein DinB
MHPELQNYLQILADLRGQVRALIADLTAEALNWRPVAGADEHATNSLAVLAAHVTGAEHFWIAEVIGGRPATRDRDAEFRTIAGEAAELARHLDAVAAETAEVLSSLSEADLNSVRVARGREVTVRWGILHMIEHTALHLGHIQITYQLRKCDYGIHSNSDDDADDGVLA